MKRLIFSSILIGLALFSSGQNFVDLFKFTYTGVPNVDINRTKDTLESSIAQTKLLTNVPIKISDSLTFLTGIDYENHTTLLNEIWAPSSMHITTLKLGLNIKHNSKLTATYLLLPKMASDYGDFSKSFQIGAIALFNYRINPQTKFSFGNYINKELFGILNVPILGFYYKSVQGKFEADIKFPIVGYAHYKLHKNIRIGADFLMIVRTFDLTQNLSADFYAQLASNEFGGYLQFNLLKESVIVKAKVIYAMFDYAYYNDGAKTQLGTLGWYPGDNRLRMNGEYENTFGFKFSAIYRFQL